MRTFPMRPPLRVAIANSIPSGSISLPRLPGAVASSSSAGRQGSARRRLPRRSAARRKRVGALLLTGRCYDLSETPPYGPWSELFTEYGRVHGDAVSGLPVAPSAFAERGGVGAVGSQATLLAEVRDFFAALTACHPVVLLLDDLHWADPASLDLLRVLARAVATMPLLVLVTYRGDELTRRHPLYLLLPLLEREAHATRLTLKPLADGAVRALIARYALPHADADTLVAYLRSRAEGNALFTTQILAALEEDGVLWQDAERWTVGDLASAQVPTALRQVIDGRVARLDPEAQGTLAVAAVVGQVVPFAVWATVSGMGEDEIEEVAAQAAAVRLVEEMPDGTGTRFVHALVREAIYKSILPIRRRRLHQAAGEALAALPNPDADAVAYHFRTIGDSRTVRWLVRAGERAREAQAIVTAVARMKEAMALLDGQEHAALAGNLAMQIGYMLRQSDRPQSIRYLEEAIRRAQEADNSVMAGIARCHLGYVFFYDNQLARGLIELRAGVAVLESLPPEARERTAVPKSSITSLTDARALLAWILARTGAYEEALRLLGLTLDAAGRRTRHTQLLCAAHHLSGRERLGRPDVAKRAYAWVRQDLQPLEGSRLLGGTLFGFLVNTVLPYHADDLAYREEIVAAAERAVVQAQTLQFVEPFPARALRFPLDFIGGAWDAAQEHASIAQRWGAGMTRRGGMTLATIARLRGRESEAWREVRRWLPEGAATEPGTQNFLDGRLLMQLGRGLCLMRAIGTARGNGPKHLTAGWHGAARCRAAPRMRHCGRSIIGRRAIVERHTHTPSTPLPMPPNRASRSPCSPPTACSANSTPRRAAMQTPHAIWTHRSPWRTPAPPPSSAH